MAEFKHSATFSSRNQCEYAFYPAIALTIIALSGIAAVAFLKHEMFDFTWHRHLPEYIQLNSVMKKFS